MSMEVKVKFDFRDIRQIFPNLAKAFQRRMGPVVIDAIKNEMKVGKSPVEGKGRFVAYSPTYQNQIKVSLGRMGKRVRPVNLYLTGKMMASANSKPVGEDGVSVGFSDKKAEYHNETGAGKSKVLRRMLPTRRGEVFSRTVMQKVMKVLQTDVIRLVLSRGK